jgi:hypothetical protein
MAAGAASDQSPARIAIIGANSLAYVVAYFAACRDISAIPN